MKGLGVLLSFLVGMSTAVIGGLQWYLQRERQEFEQEQTTKDTEFRLVQYVVEHPGYFEICPETDDGRSVSITNVGMISVIADQSEKAFERIKALVKANIDRCPQDEREMVFALLPQAKSFYSGGPEETETQAQTPAADEEAIVLADETAEGPAAATPGLGEASAPAAAEVQAAAPANLSAFTLYVQYADQGDRSAVRTATSALRATGLHIPGAEYVGDRAPPRPTLRVYHPEQLTNGEGAAVAAAIERSFASAAPQFHLQLESLGRADLPGGIMELWLPDLPSQRPVPPARPPQPAGTIADGEVVPAEEPPR